jgi:uncharacterized protein (TIGR03663 family)
VAVTGGLDATPSKPARTPIAAAVEREVPARPNLADQMRGAVMGPHGRWLVAAALVVLAAVVARFWNLGLAPFHNDEGVNGWFTTTLIRSGTWKYDPANYHGPTLFYAALVSTTLFGLNEVGMRLVPALFGLGALLIVPLARRWIGGAGALAALLLLAVSPGMIFFSRDVIHEMLLVFFTLAFVVCMTRWWENGRVGFLVLGASAAAAMFATKETAVVTFAMLGLAVVCLKIYERAAPGVLGRTPAWRISAPASRRRERAATDDQFARFGGRDRLLQAMAGAGLAFVIVWVLLFSSLFTNYPAGVLDSFRSVTIWTQTSGATQVSGPLTYLGWMAREELPIFAFGLVGALFVAWEARSRFAIVTSAWAIGLFLVYSLIGYKTPWLMLNWVVPFALVGGYALGRAWEARHALIHAGAPVVLAIGLAFSGAQAGLLVFRDYDNDLNAYVYVPTKRDVLTLVDWIRGEDASRGTGGQIGVVIMSPDYWPLPWYLRDDTKAGFYGAVVDVAAPIQIVRADQVSSLPAGFDGRYERVGQYTLRGGVDLVVYRDRGGG